MLMQFIHAEGRAPITKALPRRSIISLQRRHFKIRLNKYGSSLSINADRKRVKTYGGIPCKQSTPRFIISLFPAAAS